MIILINERRPRYNDWTHMLHLTNGSCLLMFRFNFCRYVVTCLFARNPRTLTGNNCWVHGFPCQHNSSDLTEGGTVITLEHIPTAVPLKCKAAAGSPHYHNTDACRLRILTRATFILQGSKSQPHLVHTPDGLRETPQSTGSVSIIY